ncbi:hypothetical protein H0W26_00520 [Candidatus Dependentiae bacterium]|nr:hypothetical protein [Candidatus Dependentiae bacterium]
MSTLRAFMIMHLIMVLGFTNVWAEPFMQVALESVKNTLPSACSIHDKRVLAQETTQFTKPLTVPFISIRNYLKEYTANRPYIPKEALSIDTTFGRFRLWASEQGVVCAPDIKQRGFSCDVWDTETLFDHATGEQTMKKRCLLVLVLKVLKNKLKIVLEPYHNSAT